jgi:formylglycine-generating enzyme required for sulfatase activity
MKIQCASLFLAAMVSAAAAGVAPSVSNVQMSDNGNGTVAVSYTLSNPPAVVTLDVVDADGNSIGEKMLINVAGDVNRKVTGTSGIIRWAAPVDLPRGDYQAKVTAWPMDDTPDYAVFDLASESSGDHIRYYTSTNLFPGGLLDNVAYRSSKLVMRKIRAKGVKWLMGSTAADGYVVANNAQHEVALDRNYYIAVFPLTCLQVKFIMNRDTFMDSMFILDRDLRIQDRIWYSQYTIGRGTGWPNKPTDTSILGKLRARFNQEFDFDFPSEAEWEFAARAGNGSGYWGNGVNVTLSADKKTDLNLPGQYRGNLAVDWLATTTSWTEDAKFQGPTNSVPIAGSYAPNDWGLYDMHGGVSEWCLDFYKDDITNLNGKINVCPTDATKMADGETDGGIKRVIRGGGWDSDAYSCLPGARTWQDETYTGNQQSTGVRVVFHSGLR